MRLNITALSITVALLWSGAIFLVGLANLAWPPYGLVFLELTASIYPGYHADPHFGSVVVGTLYGLLDGFICGAVFGWLYNFLAGRFSKTSA
ncbi:MAG: hypothetical protein AB7D06_01600 [Pedobacter sp.]|jgi:hypothetical protein